MAAVVVAIVGATAAGMGAERRWGARARRATGRVLDVMLYGVLPLVTFFVVTRLELTAGVGAGLAFGYVVALTVGALAWLAGEHVLRLPRPTTGSLVITSMQGNHGYLGVPVVATLLGPEQIGTAIAYDAVVSNPLMYAGGFAIGAALGSRAGDTPGRRFRAYLTRNPVLLALLLALVAPDALAPDVAVDAARAIAIGLLPLGFFVLGVNLMHEREDGALDLPPAVTPALATALGLRLLVAPALMLALSTFVLRVPDAYLLQAGMPAAINILIAGHAYGLDLRLMSGVIAWGTAIAVVVIVAVVVAAA
jgi:malate permease and related proteins